jgi:glycosyltransferase involved in cell wall biosynthesis
MTSSQPIRIYFFSPVPWEFLRQRSQHLADQFRSLGVPVTFIESTSIRGSLAKGFLSFFVAALRSLYWLVMSLLWSEGRRQSRRPLGSPVARPLFEILAPPITLPLNRFDSPLVEKLNARIHRRFLWKRVLRSMPAGETSVAFVEQLPWAASIRSGDFNRLYVDFLDDVTVYAGKSPPERFVGFLRQFAPMANAAFVTAEKLEPLLRGYGYTCPMVRVPNGVDHEWFQKAAESDRRIEDLSRIPRPRAGYVGAVYRWIDFRLVASAAKANPDVSFVFIGPYDDAANLERLRVAPNIHWLPARPYGDMPLCIREFDVCLIPFAAGEVAETTNPVKLFEYFSLGKPVLSTPMAELRKYRDLLYIVEGPEEFSIAFKLALEEKDHRTIEARKEVARAHSWREHASTILEVMKAV